MKTLLVASLFFCPLLPLAAQEGAAPSVPASERVYIGMVVDEPEAGEAGLRVRAVAPSSPAHKAGIRAGDIVLRVGQGAVNQRSELRRIVRSCVHGQVLPMELLREGKHHVLQVVLELRPVLAGRSPQPEPALAADRHMQPIPLPDDIRQEIRRHRRLLRAQLATLPEGFEPSVATQCLQAIRDLARDANNDRPGWMSGRAGEISVRFRDEEGSVVLYGANNIVTLELYDLAGQQMGRYEINSEESRRALPETVLQRLQRLR